MDPYSGNIELNIIQAILTLSGGRVSVPVDSSAIMNQVKQQIQNQVPIPEEDKIIENGLRILHEEEVIKQHGPNSYSFTPREMMLRNEGAMHVNPDIPNIARANLKRQLGGDETEAELQRKRFRDNMDEDEDDNCSGPF